MPAQPEHEIILKSDATMLNEVVVNGDIPRIRLRDDAVVATVENTVLSKAEQQMMFLKDFLQLPVMMGISQYLERARQRFMSTTGSCAILRNLI